MPMSQDRNKLKKYEIDLSRGVFKADGAEDHAAMLNALESIGKLPQWLIDKALCRFVWNAPASFR